MVETLATVTKCPSLSRNNRNNRYIARFIFYVIPDARTLRRFLANIDTQDIFGMASRKMIVPMTIVEGVGQNYKTPSIRIRVFNSRTNNLNE